MWLLISIQVAYKTTGQERTILEGAAARAFKHVSGPTLDLVLQDSQCLGGSKMSKGAKVMTIIETYRHEWGWSDADVARVMLEALPEYSKAKRRESVPQADSEDWADLAAMAEAISVVQTGPEMEAEAAPSGADTALLAPLARVMAGDCGRRGSIIYKPCV